jgi:hypothetical protein
MWSTDIHNILFQIRVSNYVSLHYFAFIIAEDQTFAQTVH